MPYWNRQKHVFWSLKQQERRLDRKIAREAEEALLPEINAAFVSDTYLKNADATNFSTLFTHTRSDLATQYDSAGVLKWCPHNLLTRSEDFDHADWSSLALGTGSEPVITPNFATDPDGASTATRVQLSLNGGTGDSDISALQQAQTELAAPTVTRSAWLKLNAGTSAQVSLELGTDGGTVTVTDEWQKLDYVDTTGNNTFDIGLRGTRETSDTVDLLVWHPHAYRSDLGGMVNNPARGDSYVPTTSSAVYLPRRNAHYYDGSAWQKGIQIETEARTNLALYSQDFTDASWLKIRVTVTGDATVSPDGNMNADLVSHDSGGTATIYQDFSVATTHTASAWLKANGTDFVQFRATQTGSSTSNPIFDLSSGTVNAFSEASVLDAGIIDQGNGWYFCYVTVDGSASERYGWTPMDDATTDKTTAGDCFYIYGAQFEEGSTPSSYIPTAGSSVTRAADTIKVPSGQTAYNSEAMSFAMKGVVTYADDGTSASTSGGVGNAVFYLWKVDGNNFVESYLNTASTSIGTVGFQQNVAGTRDFVSNSSAYSPGVNVPFNIASRHTDHDINAAIDGTARTADTTPTALPDLSATDLELAYGFMGILTEFKMWDRGLSDAELESESA